MDIKFFMVSAQICNSSSINIVILEGLNQWLKRSIKSSKFQVLPFRLSRLLSSFNERRDCSYLITAVKRSLIIFYCVKLPWPDGLFSCLSLSLFLVPFLYILLLYFFLSFSFISSTTRTDNDTWASELSQLASFHGSSARFLCTV